jgi:hypothetical protein
MLSAGMLSAGMLSEGKLSEGKLSTNRDFYLNYSPFIIFLKRVRETATLN